MSQFKVQVTLQAEALLGLILNRNRSSNEDLQKRLTAFHTAIIDLKAGKNWIFAFESETLPEAYEFYEPPLKLIFKRIEEHKLLIFDIQEYTT